MFEPKLFDQIFQEMRDRTPPRISDFEEGSVARTLYETFAFELALLYDQMHQVYLSAFVDTATGSQLDLVVAVLGIKRGEPDFAMGDVTFERDLGIDKPINIPIGFLVTTSQDSQETPKKAYQTIETRVLSETDSRVQVRVQAVQPGETEVTAANTVQVMPQPLPGIKAITNEQPIRFTGKRRETDEELRDRAKTALLAASGANISTIETALISLPGVKEVRVREPFHYARGTVRLTWNPGTSAESSGATTGVTIPPKTALALQDGTKEFFTQESVLVKPEIAQSVKVEAAIQGVPGQVTESNVAWRPLTYKPDPATEITLTVENIEPPVLRDFGVIEVFVDGVDFTDASQVKKLEAEIERVRAAGIYVVLKPIQSVLVDGVFLLELKAAQRFSTEERLVLEQHLQELLFAYLSQQRLGQPLLIAQITQTLLADKAVNDLVDFELTLWHPRLQSGKEPIYDTSSTYGSDIKRLDVEMMEKFVPRYIRVASEIKPLPIHIHMKVPNLDDDRAKQIKQSLQAYFRDLTPRQSVEKASILERIWIDLGANSLSDQERQEWLEQTTLIPEFWHPQIDFEGDQVPVSLLERAELGELLLYKTDLQIGGALRLILPLSTTEAEQRSLQDQVRGRLQAYLDRLKPEESIDLKQFGDIARSVYPVLDGVWKAGDFSVSQSGTTTPLPDRIQGNSIRVATFEKATLASDNSFIIATTIQTVMVTLTQLQLRVEITGLIPSHINRSQLEAAMRRAIQVSLEGICTQLPQPDIGQSVDYSQLQERVLPSLIRRGIMTLSPATIRALFPSSPEPLNTLDADTAGELADLTNRLLQGAKYTIPQFLLNNDTHDIFIRIVERAILADLQPSQVSIALELPYQQPSPRGGTT
jgi:hypothetical protein